MKSSGAEHQVHGTSSLRCSRRRLSVVIGKPERHLRIASHFVSKQQ